MSPGHLEEESDEARMEAFKPFMTGNALVFGTNIHIPIHVVPRRYVFNFEA